MLPLQARPARMVLVLILLLAWCAGCSDGGSDTAGQPDAGASASVSPSATEPAPATPAGTATWPASMAALGDSITVAVNATQPLAIQPQYSWSTGREPDVNSILLRLRQTNAETRASNHAVPGQQARHLAQQARGVRIGTDLVTVLIGANDACTSKVSTMTSVDSFRTAIRAGLLSLAQRAVDEVVVVSIPDMHRLWQVGRESSAARTAWQLYGICQSMLADPQSESAAAQERRTQVRARIIAFNDVLEEECAALAETAPSGAAASEATPSDASLPNDAAGGDVRTRCRFDGDAVFDAGFELSDLSTVDYFHPSPVGQAKLAEGVFAASGLPGRG